MYEIEKYSRKFRGKHPVYTEAEAKELGLEYLYWREAQEGQWCIGDDGYVAKVLSISSAGKGQLWVKTPYVRILKGGKNKMIFEGRIETKDFSSVDPLKWTEKEARKTRTKQTVAAYVTMRLNGTMDWQTLGNIYRPDQQIPEATVRRLFRIKEVKQMVEKRLEEALSKHGVDNDFVVGIYKEAIELARKGNQVGNMIKAASELAELLGMGKEKKADANEWTGGSISEIERVMAADTKDGEYATA